MKRARRRALAAAFLAAGLASGDVRGVQLSDTGLGQALIYPYYDVQITNGDGWATYLSVVNHTAKAKAIRMRFREGRNAREVAAFNLFLAPNDTWTGAVVSPVFRVGSTEGDWPAKVITADTSCTSPPITAAGYAFSNALYSGAHSDGLGDALDRTREGYVEIIEMASLKGATATTVTPSALHQVPNCSSLPANGSIPAADLEPPTGGLSGTLTLINVNSGMDAGINAVALKDLATQPFYRPVDDPYPDFNAAEVTPRSFVTANGADYRLLWSRGVDAVSSVLMGVEAINEFVRDRSTASTTDWVMTYPTAYLYAPGEAPFAAAWVADAVNFYFANREERGARYQAFCDVSPDPWCGGGMARVRGAVVLKLGRPEGPVVDSLLGSRNADELFSDKIVTLFESGWASFQLAPESFSLVSLPGSTVQHVSGSASTGRFVVHGLPFVGFMVRTFKNGTLTCSGADCQGNYGGVFPHRYRRSVTPAP